MKKLTTSLCITLLVFLGSAGQSFALPSCPSSGVFHNCFGTATYADGRKYVSEWKNNRPSGLGIRTYADGRVEDGVFKVGKFLYAEKATPDKEDSALATEGTQRDELSEAFKRWSQTERKQIQWRLSELGLYLSTIDGLFVELTRFGIHVYARLQGLGDVTTAEGARSVIEKLVTLSPSSTGSQDSTLPACPGSYNSNTWNNCFGTATHADGDKYVGEWRNDNRNGQGTYTFADGRVDEGIWENSEFLYAKKVTPDVPEKKPTVTGDPDKLVTAASGSGFAVSSSGHVITNNHVIEGCSDIKIHHDGRTTKARVVAEDHHNDLALLKGEFKPSTVLPLSRDNPQLLEEIYVAGFPFGKSISSSIKVTKGIVSSLAGLDNNVSNIQIDAALQPGNSGGPVIDENGNVEVVAVAKLDLMTVVENWGGWCLRTPTLGGNPR